MHPMFCCCNFYFVIIIFHVKYPAPEVPVKITVFSMPKVDLTIIVFTVFPCRHTVKSSTDPVESYSILSMAMKNQKLEEPDKFGQTPLHRAAYRGATVCAMLLIQVCFRPSPY